jgi:hypothetical protein
MFHSCCKCFALGFKRSGSSGFTSPFSAPATKTNLGSSEVNIFGFSGYFFGNGLGLGTVFSTFCFSWQVQVALKKFHRPGRASEGRP